VITLRAIVGLILSLCFLIGLAWVLFRAASVPKVHEFSFDAYLSIMLTALGVMIATFAILVGLAAIWGYAGLRDYLKETASHQVDKAVQETLKKYPDAADIVKALQRLEEQSKIWDQLINQSVTANEPKSVAMASKLDVEKGLAGTPLESIEKQATPIAKYPGEEDGHVNGGS
jgi:hypothetical protein